MLQAGDAILGLKSSGVHSNGFSLVRKVLEVSAQQQARGGSTTSSTIAFCLLDLAPSQLCLLAWLAVCSQCSLPPPALQLLPTSPQVSGTSLHDIAPWSGESFGLTLLTPTIIYVRDCMRLVAAADVRGLVHMTGGGFPENIPRVVPKGLAARINRSAWEVPPLFQWVQEVGGGVGLGPRCPPAC